jgi:inosine-uridine nucleoside N-ribohydrolase
MAVALEPDIITASQSLYVAIETGNGLCRGQAVVDHLGILKRLVNTEVIREVSRDDFLRLLRQSVGPRET